jgi:predicted nucleic acid-binding protein
MQWVLDASVALAWCFPDERSPSAEALLERAADSPSVVPQLWPLEVASALLQAQRRGRILAAQRVQFLSMLGTLQIHVDRTTAERAWTEVIAVAETQGLTVYDATYLELAMRLGVPLATMDDAVRAAASAVGVSLL